MLTTDYDIAKLNTEIITRLRHTIDHLEAEMLSGLRSSIVDQPVDELVRIRDACAAEREYIDAFIFERARIAAGLTTHEN